MSGKAECNENSKAWNSCRLREVPGTILVICTASGAWNTNDPLEAI